MGLRRYDKKFKDEAVKLSDDVGVKRASEQLGVSYYTLIEWRKKSKEYGELSHIGSGRKRQNSYETREEEMKREIAELTRANDILREALYFFAKDRKK